MIIEEGLALSEPFPSKHIPGSHGPITVGEGTNFIFFGVSVVSSSSTADPVKNC